MHSWGYFVKWITFCGDGDVQVGQSVLAGGHQVRVDRKVVLGIAERLYALEPQAFGGLQKRSHDTSVEIVHEKQFQLSAVSPLQDLARPIRKAASFEGTE